MLAFLLHAVPLRGIRIQSTLQNQFRQGSRLSKRHHHVGARTFCVAASNSKQSSSITPVPSSSKSDDITGSKSSVFEQIHPTVKEYLSLGLSVVILKSGKFRIFQSQRPTTVYPAAIDFTYSHSLTQPEIAMSSPVAVLDSSYKPFAYGVYNPSSMFRVRILRHLPENKTHEIFKWQPNEDIKNLLINAVNVRKIIGLPNQNTNIYRVVNGDGDGISGLFIDRFGDAAVISSCATWCEAFRNDIEHTVKELLQKDGVHHVIWRPNVDRLRQDGFIEEDDDSEKVKQLVAKDDNNKQEHSTSSGINDEEDHVVIAKEEGVLYELSWNVLRTGQKTGHFADQREARLYIRNLISAIGMENKECLRVADLFCYSGGFALNAALSNPERVKVTAVDSSSQALELGKRNADLNNVSNVIQFIRSDISKYVKNHGGQLYHMVIVDPPKYAPNMKSLPRALGKYKRVNEAALKLINKDGGILISCSCSAAVAHQRHLLIEAVREGALGCGRKVQLLKTFGGSVDHPVHVGMLETEYLTICVFSVR